MSRINQTTMPQIPQIKKIFCAYHPNEFLTNFCCDLNCLMPLCPNCIVQHTQQHFLQNNKPMYVNIHDAITDTKQKCYQHIVVYEQLSRANDKLYDYVVGLRESIHNQLMEDKLQIVREIEVLFENYEEKLMAQAIKKYRQLQVFDKQQTANITSFILEQIQSLQEAIAVLKSESCLAGLITYYANDGQVYEDSIKEIQEYIGKHKQAGKICVSNDMEKLCKNLEGLCENNIVVEYINQDMIKEKIEESNLKASQRSREGKTLASRLAQKQATLSHQIITKQNNQNHSNNQYKNNTRRQDYNRFQPLQLKYSKAVPSKTNYPTYQRTSMSTIRHHY